MYTDDRGEKSKEIIQYSKNKVTLSENNGYFGFNYGS